MTSANCNWKENILMKKFHIYINLCEILTFGKFNWWKKAWIAVIFIAVFIVRIGFVVSAKPISKIINVVCSKTFIKWGYGVFFKWKNLNNEFLSWVLHMILVYQCLHSLRDVYTMIYTYITIHFYNYFWNI